MSLLLDADELAGRAGVAAGALSPLARSLAGELDAVIAHGVDIPARKALLSRDGGRCPRDGAALDFDPFSPHEHRCPTCGETYRGERHDRWWIMWYQLWLAERALHGAVLGALLGDARYQEFARQVIGGYGDAYLAYPNRDNVLGPARPFFSTYLESIWLLQLSIAVDVLEMSGAAGNVGRRARDRIIEPSAALIASYDEGASNRQVWNNAALLAAARLLDRDDDADVAVWGESGLSMHLSDALLADGTWYEGENYHFFAHRGLWYGVTMAERAGQEVMAPLVARFDAGFSAPLFTALPDFTFPSRRDSQYAVSLRQWRFAESWELGLARSADDDPLLVGALAELYGGTVPRGDTGRARSTAEAERNVPPSSLTRADLNWRSLLFARPELPALVRVAPRSAVLEGQGIAVFRRAGAQVYAALDYGVSGGGHGHPDRLNVIIAHESGRWLDDVGTGSYVDPSLHWYRSTLAHNAPLVNGVSQAMVDGELVAFDERGDAGWVDARVPPEGLDAETRRALARIADPNERRRVAASVMSEWVPPAGIAPDVHVHRALVAMPEYVLDELRFDAGRASRLELPLHIDARPDDLVFANAVLTGGAGEEDGFAFVRDAQVAPLAASTAVRAPIAGPPTGELWILSDEAAECWRAIAPGAPRRGDAPFLLLRATGRQARFVTIWNWGTPFAAVTADGGTIRITLESGAQHAHARSALGWTIRLDDPVRWSASAAADAPAIIELRDARARDADRDAPPAAADDAVGKADQEMADDETDEDAVDDGDAEYDDDDEHDDEEIADDEVEDDDAGADEPPLDGEPEVDRAIVPRIARDSEIDRDALIYELREDAYRRSESSWEESGEPSAEVRIAATSDDFVIDVVVRKSDVTFRARDAADPMLDNEPADIHSDGVQLHLDAPGWSAAASWICVPEAGGTVRIHRGSDARAGIEPRATWHALPDGYTLRILIPLGAMSDESGTRCSLDVLVNDMAPDRERRRGQLVLSGGAGEYVYLRGDRQPRERLMPFFVPAE